ncbi:hypothetical protein XU18_1490 [Perkinsela sp. CCAP 1560/4]|nr:hypothetical protein XU18_1490 [Perkinsela sp. CCAP 1560/4]|eukprot:KNH07904.1 hypothetical protein XU18_1490 [Perkinsela sp. CCAP 1560/4]
MVRVKDGDRISRLCSSHFLRSHRINHNNSQHRLDSVLVRRHAYTRQVAVQIKASVSSASNMSKRLAFAQSVYPKMRNQEHFFVFHDEVSFYMDIAYRHGYTHAACHENFDGRSLHL